MKIGVMSDMHLEFGAYEGPIGTGDVLLLAGDITVAAYLHLAARTDIEVPARAKAVSDNTHAFIDRALENYDYVLTIAGNHEHYHGIFNHTHAIMRQYLHRDRLMILEKEAVHIRGVNFFGGTFWTDYNRHDAHTMLRAQGYMSDHHIIKVQDAHDLMEYRNFHPEDAYVEHTATLRDLHDIAVASKESDTPLVVMSHHAPSKRSTHPRYRDQYEINGAYSSDLERLFGPHLPLWVHGHTHDNHDYVVNDTRVVCNPRGYYAEALNRGFKGDLLLEVGNG